MKIINKVSLFAAVLLSLLVLTPNLAMAESTKSAIQQGVNCAASSDCSQPSGSLDTTVATIVNVLSAIVGIAAVIMIVIAGLRYVTSGGKEEGVKNAKNSILYAIIGLVIVALAQLIVHFVLNQTNKATASKNSSSLSLRVG